MRNPRRARGRVALPGPQPTSTRRSPGTSPAIAIRSSKAPGIPGGRGCSSPPRRTCPRPLSSSGIMVLVWRPCPSPASPVRQPGGQPGASQPSACQPSASYADPRLAALYDVLSPRCQHRVLPRPARPAAGPDPGHGLRYGTARLRVRGQGHHVTALTGGGDAIRGPGPSGRRPGPLDPGGCGPGDQRPLRPDHHDRARVQLLLEDGDVGRRSGPWPATSRRAAGSRSSQEPGRAGVAGLEPAADQQRVEAGGIVADVHYDISAVSGDLVTYGPGTPRRRRPRRGPGHAPLHGSGTGGRFLAEGGPHQVSWYGDWDGYPAADQPEIIAVASGNPGPDPGTAGPDPGTAGPERP